MQTNRVIVYSLLVGGTILLNCSESTGPSHVNPLLYKWAVDSILPNSGLQVWMKDVWASSPTNAYAVGFSSNRNQHMYYFDGVTWAEVKFPRPPSISVQVDLDAINGLDRSAIWAVGDFRYMVFPSGEWVDSSFVLFFNGSSWTVQLQGLGGRLLAVHPISPSDVWAGGLDSTMLHFDGSNWDRVRLPRQFRIARIAHTPSGQLFASAYSIHQPGGYFDIFFLKYELGEWILADSTDDQSAFAQRFGLNGLVSNGEVFYTGGYGVSRYSQGQWTTFLPYEGEYIFDVEPFSNETLLAGGTGALLRYHDGSMWRSTRIPLPERAEINSIWSNGNNIIMTGNNPSLTVTYLIRSME